MENLITENPGLFVAIAFPIAFTVMWLGVTSLLAVLSGWFALLQQYPDRDERALVQLNWQSGSMGPIGVSLRNILKLGVCSSGLRVGMFRPFGVFARDFFVPWRDITATKRTVFLWPMTELTFGNPSHGKLSIFDSTAERLIKAAEGRPEIVKALKAAMSNSDGPRR